MIIYRGFGDRRLRRKKRAVAIGIFDGVHRGHQAILKKLLSEAKKLRASPMVVTFDPHPSVVLFPAKKSPAVLMSVRHRLAFIASLGVKEALVIPFTKHFSRTPREKFLRGLLIGRAGMASLSVGNDFRFGHKASGNAVFLKSESARLGFRLSLVKPVRQGAQVVSSTRIRLLIERSELGKARRMLGRPVSVCGTVVHGRGRGKSIGFPTANLDPHHEALPPDGVYAAYGYLNGRKLKGAIHIGRRPTFGDNEKSLEVHFLDFHGNLYGREVELVFVSRLRGTQCFKSPSALVQAIRRDVRKALTQLG